MNLIAGNITINNGGGGPCDTPTVTSGATASPTVTLTNCTGDGTVGITVGAGAASDSAGNQNLASLASATVTLSNNPCPSGYVLVPGNGLYGTSDFCVMKYEAKAERDSDQVIHSWGCDNDSVATTGDADCTGVATNWVNALPQPSTPVSVPEGRPWRKIDRAQAIAECQSLGAGYDLTTNDEWQTIARNIELVASNWSGRCWSG